MVEREVTFDGVAGMTLAGTLALPEGGGKAKRFPAMLLLPGSGPTDRDGNQLPAFHTDLLKQIAGLLAERGIGSLRYDKRLIGGSKRVPPGQSMEDIAAWQNFVGDAMKAFDFLRHQSPIDASRVGILGHSEGGLIALDSARALNGAPAVLVLASTAGRRLDVVIHGQLVRILKLQKATPEQTKYFLDKNDAISETVRKTGKVPGDVPPGLAALYPPYIGKYYKGVLALDPAELAVTYGGPVMILQGERDVQVSARADAPALDAALRRRPHDDHTLVLVSGASHNLKIVKDDAAPGVAGPIAPQAASRLTEWLVAKLHVK
jgi:dienelactone hydrolase